MRSNPGETRPEEAGLGPWGNRATAELEEAKSPFGETGWWLGGGVGLLAWTGLALLMTGRF